jgi:hypothetical protein
MVPTLRHRRAFLLGCSALAAGVAGLSVAARRSLAFTGAPRSAAPATLGLAGCRADPRHEEIAARVLALLDGRPATPGTAVSQTVTCPYCGCPVTVSRQF